MTIIDLLQKEVYRIDRLIGNLADELRLETRQEYERIKSLENYETYSDQKTIILECIEKLKSLNL